MENKMLMKEFDHELVLLFCVIGNDQKWRRLGNYWNQSLSG